MNQPPTIPRIGPATPDVRVNVSLTEDRNAIVVRYIASLPGFILSDVTQVLPLQTAEAVAKAMLDQHAKASSRIVIPQPPLKGS